jgi:methionyl-tRNA formyltransferase
MRLVYFGSGAFGLPTLRRLLDEHDVELVVSQPDRPAGRKRVLTPTPISAASREAEVTTITPERVDGADVIERIRGVDADAWVVVAYGHKLGPALLDGVFAVNLHASLLPKYRGAAPIQWAMINGDRETGVSVITLADRMDAGDVLARRITPIDPAETAGDLHDRLADLGPDAVLETLARHADGSLVAETQDETLVTLAPKLSKADGSVDFDRPADAVRARVHGLTPWPGCAVVLDGARLLLRRVEVASDDEPRTAPPGTLMPDGTVACRPGAVRMLLVQAPGKRAMPFDDWRLGHELADDARMEAV